MSEREGVPTMDEIPLSPPAAAVLEFTSNIPQRKRPRELTYITSKDAYIWAGVAGLITEYAHFGRVNPSVQIDAVLYRTIADTLRASPPRETLPLLGTFQDPGTDRRAIRQAMAIPAFGMQPTYGIHISCGSW
jgi:hypothetical protein